MDALIKLLVDNGISVVCVAYLIYFQSTTMTRMLTTLNLISERLAKIETKLEIDGDSNA